MAPGSGIPRREEIRRSDASDLLEDFLSIYSVAVAPRLFSRKIENSSVVPLDGEPFLKVAVRVWRKLALLVRLAVPKAEMHYRRRHRQHF